MNELTVQPNNGIAKTPVRLKDRKFIDAIVFQGMEWHEAYALAFNKEITDGNLSSMRVKAESLFNRPGVKEYYHSLMDNVRAVDLDQAVWSREKATKTLNKLIVKAGEELYDLDGKITMARVNAIVTAAKELNAIHGLNESTLNVNSKAVVITGEAKILD
jgi:hypothetical protein